MERRSLSEIVVDQPTLEFAVSAAPSRLASYDSPVNLHIPHAFNPDSAPPIAGYYEGEFALILTTQDF